MAGSNKKRNTSVGGDDSISKRLKHHQSQTADSNPTSPDEAESANMADDEVILSDTVVALKMMHSQFPKIDKVCVQPFVLRSQLYSSITDRTAVDRELEENDHILCSLSVQALRRRQEVRMFKLSCGQDDFAIMFFDDYIHQLDAARERMESKHKDDRTKVLEWFKLFVICTCTEVHIPHADLIMLLSNGGPVNDEHISVLINAGLLVRKLSDEESYWFSIPNVGFLVKSLVQGRKELLQFLSRRRYKEMLLTALEKRKLRFSSFDMRFHVRDLLGSHHLMAEGTPSGVLIRLSRS